MGHVGRCSALAQALATLNWDARVLVTDDGAARWVRSVGVKTVRDASGPWSLAVIDSYRRPLALARSLSESAATIVAIDDLHQVAPNSVDLVVRPSIGERTASHVVGGPDYVLLRKEYWRRGRRIASRSVRRVLVALGGYADRRLLSTVVDALGDVLPGVEIVVAGRRTGGSPRPRAMVRFVGHVRSLRQLMLQADIAVTGGGQTMNEALACGAPTLVLATAANQRRNVSAAVRANVAQGIGSSSGTSWEALLRKNAAHLSARYSERVKLGRNARLLIDGKGALRVARILGDL